MSSSRYPLSPSERHQFPKSVQCRMGVDYPPPPPSASLCDPVVELRRALPVLLVASSILATSKHYPGVGLSREPPPLPTFSSGAGPLSRMAGLPSNMHARPPNPCHQKTDNVGLGPTCRLRAHSLLLASSPPLDSHDRILEINCRVAAICSACAFPLILSLAFPAFSVGM